MSKIDEIRNKWAKFKELEVYDKAIHRDMDVFFQHIDSLEQKLAKAREASQLLDKRFEAKADGTILECRCESPDCARLHLSRGDTVYVVSYVDAEKFDQTRGEG